jgi:hypothetical protein
MVKVIYSTDGFIEQSGCTGQQKERTFPSLAAARTAPFPQDYTFAFIPVENGRDVFHSQLFGWEFQSE